MKKTIVVVFFVSFILMSVTPVRSEHSESEQIGIYIESYHKNNPYLILSHNKSSTFCFENLRINVYSNKSIDRVVIFDRTNSEIIKSKNFSFHTQIYLSLKKYDMIDLEVKVSNFSLRFSAYVSHRAKYLSDDPDDASSKYVHMSELEFLLEQIKIHYLSLLIFLVAFAVGGYIAKRRKETEEVHIVE